MTDSTSTRPLAVVLTELGWKPEVLARQLNSFAALQGRVERMHAKTPYKWLRGDRPLSPWPALTAALVTDELGRPITSADLGWGEDVVEAVSAISGLVLPWTAARGRPRRLPGLPGGGDPERGGRLGPLRRPPGPARRSFAPYRRRPAIRQLTEQAASSEPLAPGPG